MNNMKKCQKCGVPSPIIEGHVWLNNGCIVHRYDQKNRLVLFETESIDPVFKNIEELIGMPIEHLAITSVRRAVHSWLSPMFPDEMRDLIREKKVDGASVFNALVQLNMTMGVGRVELIDSRLEWDKDDFWVFRIHRPFSVPLAVGGVIAGVEAFYGDEVGYNIEEISPDAYELRSFPSPHPKGLKERMQLSEYRHLGGDVELERCPSCGGPIELSRYTWDLDEGIIMDGTTNRRMIMHGAIELDIVFQELEDELGATIPRVIVEAQRRFTKSSALSIFDVTTAEEFRNLLAVRGMGYLENIDVSRKGLSMRLKNAALPLMIVGMMQGVFEKAIKQDTIVEWELSEYNELDINLLTLAH